MSPRAGSDASALARASDVVWRSGVLALAGVLVGALIWRLRAIAFPVFVALLVCTALGPLVAHLERRGWRPLLATWLVFGASVAGLAGVLLLMVPAVIDQLDDVGVALSDGTDAIEDWLVGGPADLEREDVRRYTRDPLGRLGDLVSDSSASVLAGARTAAEVVIGTVLALVLTFLLLKDGPRLQQVAVDLVPAPRRELVRAVSRRVWASLGGFLRGAATLGLVEGSIIGITMAVIGAPLAAPVAVLTFFGAFFPIVGAVVMGGVAVLVTLATAGPGSAAVVLVVVVVVQQLDNDLLAPFIYGHSLHLHPIAVLLSLAAGASLGGIIGAFVAVPLVSAAWGVGDEVLSRRQGASRAGPPEPP